MDYNHILSYQKRDYYINILVYSISLWNVPVFTCTVVNKIKNKITHLSSQVQQRTFYIVSDLLVGATRVSNDSHQLNLPEHLSSPSAFSGVRVTRFLVVYVCFVDRCLSFCTFFFWLLCCLFFFDIRILITPLVSSNSTNETIWSTLNQNIIKCN